MSSESVEFWAFLLVAIIVTLAIIHIFRGRSYREEALLLRETLYRSNYSVALLQLDGRIIFWNHAIANLTGQPAIQVLGHRIAEISPFSEDHPLIRIFSSLHKQPFSQPLTFRTQIQRVNPARLSPVIVNLTRFSIVHTGNDMILLALDDISEAEELRDRLQKALSEAESSVRKMTELDKLKSEFLAICGHELKTPLVSITGYLDLIASDKLGPTTQKQQNALAISLRNASRLNAILSQLLDFARMEAGKMRFEFTAQRISGLLEEIIGTVYPMASSKGLRITLEAPTDLAFAYFDAPLLHRVILNLIDNAIKFTPQGGEITIRAWEEQGRIHVAISDSGIGIPQEKLGHVTEAFYQIDGSNTRKTGGLGLGLAIAEKILSGHGTRLNIDSRPDSGTKVSFSLKRAVRTASGKFEAMTHEPFRVII
ncbi:MAG: PAS domain-containing protein [Candidatus Riflebacteria bacterium]|nr:PAS domain-containing protein [Candidatus Riflebacteria bacterium]